MLIFNCSQAFAAHIELKGKTSSPLVGPPPSPHPTQDAPFLIDSDGQPPRAVQHWLVHFIRLQRQPCAVAMELETRYAMVFTGVKKGDPEAFLNAFTTRLANEMALAAHDVGMLSDFEAMLVRFLELHTRFQFFRRSERSTQTHLAQAIRDFRYRCEDAGALPQSHEACALIDDWINDTPRTIKGRKGYFIPGTEMLCHWLTQFGGLTAAGEAAVREKIRLSHQRKTDFTPETH